MAWSINGIGTTYYGKTDRRLDGSYVTTKWFTFLYLPIVPFSSWRFRDQAGGGYWVVYSSDEFEVVEKLPLSIRQVAATYGLVGMTIALAVLTSYLAASVPLIGLSLLLPPLLFFTLRFKSYRQFRKRLADARRASPADSE